MKIFAIFIFISSVQIYSQTYINVLFSDGSYKNSQISSLQKITLSSNGDLIYFHNLNGTVSTESIADIEKFTLDDIQLGEPLPVELSAFNIFFTGSSVELSWRTETEVNNLGFEVERSQGSEIKSYWEKIGFVEGHGNSNSAQNYTYSDNLPTNDIYHYRLKQIDIDGKYEYSQVVSIVVNPPGQYLLGQNFPNPFNPETKISYSIPLDGMVTIKIYDMIGREISSLVNENQKAGSYITTFDGSKYASGVYICRINSGKFSSSIKMLLLK